MEHTTAQFKHCHATKAYFYDPTNYQKGFVIFYSYTTPKIVHFPDWYTARFTFEGSRKEGSITESHTTSKQCNQRLEHNHKELPTINLKEFEDKYFDTRLEIYY